MDYFLLTTLIMLNVAYVAVFALAGKATGTDSFDGMTTTVDRGRLSGRSASNIFAPVAFYPHRSLELTEGQCWSTRDDRKPNRYCIFDDTPRNGAFLSLSCPTTSDDLTQCGCTIGIGDSGDAPNTDTCGKCGFCIDGSLAYDCRNVAEGTCIGRNCMDDCISSYSEPQDLLLGSSDVRRELSLSLTFFSLSVVCFLWE